MRSIILVASIAVVVIAVGCSAMDPAYIKADEATYKAVQPYYDRAVDADKTLSDDDKRAKHALMRSWRARLNRAEGQPISATASPEN